MFGDKKKKTGKKSNKEEMLPKVKKVDANGEKQRIPKGYKATVSKSGTIIMVSKSSDLSGKPKKEKQPVKPSADEKKTATKKAVPTQPDKFKSEQAEKQKLAGEVYDLLTKKYDPKEVKALPRSRQSFIRLQVNKSLKELKQNKKELQAELVKPKSAPKKNLKGAPSAKVPKKDKPVKKAPKVEKIMHDDNYERGTDVVKPIVIKPAKPKRANRKELRRVAKVGGYTVFDGPRAGKTFETPKEAAEYAADLLKRTGIIYKVEKTDRQVSHTFRAEDKAEK